LHKLKLSQSYNILNTTRTFYLDFYATHQIKRNTT